MELTSFKSKTPSEVAAITVELANRKNSPDVEEKNPAGYVTIGNEVTSEASKKKGKISSRALLIYAIIKSRMNAKTRRAYVSNHIIAELAGYGDDTTTITRATNQLHKAGYFVKITKGGNSKQDHTYITYNEYVFPEDAEENYEIHTRLFLNNKNLSRKVKEFIILMQHHIFGTKDMDYDYTDLTKAKIVKTIGWGKDKVRETIQELIDAGYWESKGHKNIINLNKLQLDGAEFLMQENISQAEELSIAQDRIAKLVRENKRLKNN